MANRSTFSRKLPRNIVKLAALTQAPSDFHKRQLVEAIDFKTGAPRVDADGKKFTVWQVLPDYDRVVRELMLEAHSAHKAFKLKRLSKEVVSEIAKTAESEAA